MKASTILLCLFVGLLSVAPALAQPDPSIRDWGNPPGTPPPWQTPDVWVDNNGNEIPYEANEPARGIQNNRLFARIRNLGSTATAEVQVRFAFAPYGLWAPASHADFKEIDVVTVPPLSPGEEKTIEVEWDLSDLSENNGGAWGGFTVNDFSHFCVLVTLTSQGDTNPSNNIAQNNFTWVPIAPGKTSMVKFLVANPKAQPATAELLLAGLPERWQVRLDGLQRGRNTLQPREVRLVTLSFTPPARETETAAPLAARGDLSLRLDGQLVGGISMDAHEPAAAQALFPPAGGSLSPYLIGTYDLRGGQRAVVQVLNPTGRPVRVLAAFFDDDEKPLACLRERLSANDLLEIDVRRHVQAPLGVVKIVSFEEDGDRPVAGIAGYQNTYVRKLFRGIRLGTQAPLHAIPAEILEGDMAMIRRACQ
jgi:hypothetical protein